MTTTQITARIQEIVKAPIEKLVRQLEDLRSFRAIFIEAKIRKNGMGLITYIDIVVHSDPITSTETYILPSDFTSQRDLELTLKFKLRELKKALKEEIRVIEWNERQYGLELKLEN
jgi:hypothetical protein